MGVTRIRTAGEPEPAAQADTTRAVVKILPEHVGDPKVLARKLNDQAKDFKAKIDEAFTSPLLGGVILHDVALSAGVTTNLKHGLGKAWSGYQCTRAQTAAFSAFQVAAPTGLTRAEVLSIRSNNTGTYDIWVF